MRSATALHVLLLFLGVLREFRLYALAGNPGRGDRVHRVAQHADDLGRENGLKNCDRFAGIATIGRRHGLPVRGAGVRARAMSSHRVRKGFSCARFAGSASYLVW